MKKFKTNVHVGDEFKLPTLGGNKTTTITDIEYHITKSGIEVQRVQYKDGRGNLKESHPAFVMLDHLEERPIYFSSPLDIGDCCYVINNYTEGQHINKDEINRIALRVGENSTSNSISYWTRKHGWVNLKNIGSTIEELVGKLTKHLK